MHEITLKIKAPSLGHLEQAIAMGMITPAFLNAVSGDINSSEMINEEGNILFEKIELNDLLWKAEKFDQFAKIMSTNDAAFMGTIVDSVSQIKEIKEILKVPVGQGPVPTIRKIRTILETSINNQEVR